MKNLVTILLLSLMLIFSSCGAENVDEINRLANAERERIFVENYNNFLDESIPKMQGRWKVSEMNTLELNSLQVDSVLYNVGEIELSFTDISYQNNRLNNFYLDGVFHINNHSIPFYSSCMLATYEANVCHITVQSHFFNDFVDNTLIEEDIKIYNFIYDHFIHENFDMELTNNGANLILTGTSKKNKKIILTKIQ